MQVKPNNPASVSVSARTFLFMFPAWRFDLLEQLLFCTFCFVYVLFLLVSVSADGLLGLMQVQ
jgi:hypothetical protein